MSMERVRKQWTEEQSNTIFALQREGKTSAQIGAIVGRSRQAVDHQLGRLRSGKAHAAPPPNEGKPYTAQEANAMLEMRRNGRSTSEIALAFGRTEGSVRSYLYKITELALLDLGAAEPAVAPKPAVVLKPSKPGRIVRPIPDAAERNKLIADHAKAKRFLPPDWRSRPAVIRVYDLPRKSAAR